MAIITHFQQHLAEQGQLWPGPVLTETPAPAPQAAPGRPPLIGPDRSADLKKNLQAGAVLAFVGAGLSVSAGLPGWYGLVQQLTQSIGYEIPPPRWATGDALIDAVQTYINERSLHDLVMHLKDALPTSPPPPPMPLWPTCRFRPC
jgi:hypothetical protein